MAPQLTKSHERNVTSQCGEDGIVDEIFRVLGIAKGVAVEFGAWDGVYLSNTAELRERGWKTVLIEGDVERFTALAAHFKGNPLVLPVHRFVRPEGPDCLDAILAEHGIDSVDFLSIDIDGDDAHILEHLKLRPKLICIEVNPTFAPPLDLVNPPGAQRGSSLAAVHRIGQAKDYDLVWATTLNAFLLDRRLGAPLPSCRPAEVYDWSNARFVICGYDGSNEIVDGRGERRVARNPWDQIEVAYPLVFGNALLGMVSNKSWARSLLAPWKRLWSTLWRIARLRG